MAVADSLNPDCTVRACRVPLLFMSILASTVAPCRYCVRGLHVEHLRGNADNCRVCHEPERVSHEPARAPPESERNWNLAGRKCHEPGVTLVEHPASMALPVPQA